jgi:hypothetical protein
MSMIYFEDYRYGVMLAEQGIGLWELSRDWPEVLESEYAMRGYRASWRWRGYCEPPGEIWRPVPDDPEECPF